MTVWNSTDETRTWDGGTPIYDGPSAYSDQVELDSETSGLLFEAGVTGPYEGITFVRFRPRS
jgi:sialidase-1